MLMIVIACFLALIWLTKRVQNNTYGGRRSMQVIETLPLGRNEKLCIVKVGDQYQMLGVTINGINLLRTLDSPDDVGWAERQ